VTVQGQFAEATRVEQFTFTDGTVWDAGTIAAALNQFDLVTFRRIDESNRAAVAVGMRPVGERVAFRGRLFREFLDVIDLEGEMRQVRSDHHRTAFVEFAKLDFYIASRRFQEDKLRTAARGMAANFFQTEYIPIERNRLFQVRHAIACMQKLLDHRYLIAPNDA
jgi:hypothetical protein